MQFQESEPSKCGNQGRLGPADRRYRRQNAVTCTNGCFDGLHRSILIGSPTSAMDRTSPFYPIALARMEQDDPTPRDKFGDGYRSATLSDEEQLARILNLIEGQRKKLRKGTHSRPNRTHDLGKRLTAPRSRTELSHFTVQAQDRSAQWPTGPFLSSRGCLVHPLPCMGRSLCQAPRFSVGMSSPIADLLEGVVSQVSAGTELSRMVDGPQREEKPAPILTQLHKVDIAFGPRSQSSPLRH